MAAGKLRSRSRTEKFLRGFQSSTPTQIGRGVVQSTSLSSSSLPIAAARQILAPPKQHLSNAESFAVETTLSGKGYLQMMVEARTRGFEVVLIYIGTTNVEVNLARIRSRVLQGGHDVPEKDVRRRYKRTFVNLHVALTRADHTILFDNSTEEGYRLVAAAKTRELVHS